MSAEIGQIARWLFPPLKSDLFTVYGEKMVADGLTHHVFLPRASHLICFPCRSSFSTRPSALTSTPFQVDTGFPRACLHCPKEVAKRVLPRAARSPKGVRAVGRQGQGRATGNVGGCQEPVHRVFRSCNKGGLSWHAGDVQHVTDSSPSLPAVEERVPASRGAPRSTTVVVLFDDGTTNKSINQIPDHQQPTAFTDRE